MLANRLINVKDDKNPRVILLYTWHSGCRCESKKKKRNGEEKKLEYSTHFYWANTVWISIELRLLDTFERAILNECEIKTVKSIEKINTTCLKPQNDDKLKKCFVCCAMYKYTIIENNRSGIEVIFRISNDEKLPLKTSFNHFGVWPLHLCRG